MQERVRALRLQYPGPMFVIHDADHSADNVTLELQVWILYQPSLSPR